jgi:signal transduction histidine kinase
MAVDRQTMNTSVSLTEFATRLSLRWRRPLLVAVLALLYLVILLGPTNPVARTLFVVHLGLFMLWQPFVRADRQVALPVLMAMLSVVAVISLGLNDWLLALWITLLAGVVGGKVFLFDTPWTKLFFLMALSWLVAALLLLVLPAALSAAVATGKTVVTLGHMAAPVLLGMMILLPERREAEGQPEVVDFVYSVVVVLLLSVLVLGSLALMLLLRHAYVEALLETLLGIGASLLILGWVWNPHLGMAGIGTVFSRYLMSIGMPVEQWLHELADLAQRQHDPDAFVAEACRDMVRSLPWVTGVAWSASSAEGSFGACRGRCSEFTFDALSLRIYTRYPLSPSLSWHFNLLAQLIAEFRADKLRARELKRLSYVEAIHETGARLTHDVKNLLQSLRALCTAAQGEGEPVSPELVALLRRQLPAITARLGQTLEKLQAPRLDDAETIPVARWWHQLQARYASSGIRFVTTEPLATVQVPARLFDHVIENLLANALDKRSGAPDLVIEASLQVTAEGLGVEVVDDGAAIPSALARDLFRGPVPSEAGMGIGLYQAARLLEKSGFALTLRTNESGRVCFRLASIVPERQAAMALGPTSR